VALGSPPGRPCIWCLNYAGGVSFLRSTAGRLPVREIAARDGRNAPWPLLLGFAATGVGVALPGALLPAITAQWHLRDEQSGRLFLLAWIGSSVAALLVRGSLRTVLLCGAAAVSIGSASLAFCHGRGAGAWILLYGLGLGLTMTSISLIRERQASRPAPELLRLNLWWALGAFVCPSLTVWAQGSGQIAPMLCGMALVFALLGVWASLRDDLRIETSDRNLPAAWTVFRAVPFGLIVMTMLSTGIEASAGAWLATYAKRNGAGVAGIIGTPTCFWAGLLISRWFWSCGRHAISHDRIFRGSVALAATAWVVITTVQFHSIVLAASFCLGFGIGPTYPVLLSWALRFRRGGSIFFLAGVGSSALPWLTGLVSGHQHSLRAGLMVPIVGSLWMVGTSLLLPLSRWEESDAEVRVELKC
jgi:MFS transporter, FHS family, glucose/mannose:H+ symporter